MPDQPGGPDHAWSPDRPHDQLPMLPPAADLETKRILKACIEARAALAELKQSVELIPNPNVLITSLPLLEAQSSSEIENIVTTADKLFEHLRSEAGADPATKEALRYRTALLEGFHSLARKPLSTSTAETVCSTIMGTSMTIRRVPGTTLASTRTGEVIYTPPVGETRLRDLLGNWEHFIHADSNLDPLVRLAAAHYQFEAIHPFTDGNGRTGRILNILALVESGLLTQPVLYLSRAINASRAEYYDKLLAVTSDGAWEDWVLYILEGVTTTARWTQAMVASIRDLATRTASHIRETLPKIYRSELVDVLFEQPYCRIASLVEAGIAKRQAASTYLSELVRIGVLESKASGREKIFINKRLFKLLTRENYEVEKF